MNAIQIKSCNTENLADFLTMRNFEVDDLGDGVFEVVRNGELPVFVTEKEGSLYFELDLGPAKDVAERYFDLLDINTAILPVSVGINNANPEDPRLVLVESRQIGDLSAEELLEVFDAMELAVERYLTPLLQEVVSQQTA